VASPRTLKWVTFLRELGDKGCPVLFAVYSLHASGARPTKFKTAHRCLQQRHSQLQERKQTHTRRAGEEEEEEEEERKKSEKLLQTLSSNGISRVSPVCRFLPCCPANFVCGWSFAFSDPRFQDGY
jgi:hypothetical protein